MNLFKRRRRKKQPEKIVVAPAEIWCACGQRIYVGPQLDPFQILDVIKNHNTYHEL